MKRNDRIRRENVYYHFLSMAGDEGATEIQIDDKDLQIVLEFIGESEADANLTPAFKALVMAKASDTTNVDKVIADFATSAEMPDSIRRGLFEKVIKERDNSITAPILIDYAGTAEDPKNAIVALDAINYQVNEEHAEGLLKIIASTSFPEVRQEAADLMEELIDDSKKRNQLAQLIAKVSKEDGNDASREAFAALQKRCKDNGSFNKQTATNKQTSSNKQTAANKQTAPKPLPNTTTPKSADKPPSEPTPELKKYAEALNGDDEAEKIKAIEALGKCGNLYAHGVLQGFAQNTKNRKYLTKTIAALVELNSRPVMVKDGDQARQRFKQTIWRTKTDEQKKLVVEALGNIRMDWATLIVKEMSKGNSESAKRARQILEQIDKRGK